MCAAAAVSLVFALFAAPADAQAQQTVVCDEFSAWTLERSKPGLPVRERPARDARILGYLADPEEGMAAMVLVEGYREGWFRIASDDWKPVGGSAASGMKSGWVEARRLMLDVYDPVLRSRPEADAPVSARLRETLLDTRTDNPDITMHALLECRGVWKRVSTSRGIGWARATCGNPETTCP